MKKLICVGLGKTGTTSFGRSAELLGYETHETIVPDLVRAYAVGNYDPIMDAVAKNEVLEDWPFPLVYRELYEAFPEAHFVLTRRKTSAVWYKSLVTHAERHLSPTDFEMRKIVYGCYMPHDFREQLVSFYEKHLQDVRAFFGAMRQAHFLEVCWEEGDGWRELTEFLGVAMPAVEFPHLNARPSGRHAVGVRPRFRRRVKQAVKALLGSSSI